MSVDLTIVIVFGCIFSIIIILIIAIIKAIFKPSKKHMTEEKVVLKIQKPITLKKQNVAKYEKPKKEARKLKKEEKEKPKKSNWSFFIIVVAVILVILAVIWIVNNQSIFKSRPNPVVLSSECIGYWNVLDYRIEVKVRVRNEGGSGTVRVIGELDQSGPEFDDSASKDIYMGRNQIETVSFYFDGSSFRDENCYGRAYAIG